jgi:hypothetical protein
MNARVRTARPSDRSTLLVWSLVCGLGLFLIECVYLYVKQGPFFGALGWWVVPLVAAYLGTAFLLAFALGGRNCRWRAFGFIAFVFFAIESTKMFVISAPLLRGPMTLGGFALGSLLLFTGLVAVARRLRLDPSVLFWLVWVYSASCYAVAFQWRTAGGELAVFLRSPSVLLVVAAAAVAFLLVLWISRQARRSLVVGTVVAVISAATLAAMPGSASKVRGGETAADDTLPDIYIASFDALGRDVLAHYCEASDGAAARLCARGLHFQNIVADGLATYEILSANTFGGRSSSRCEDSLAGLAAARGYETSMWLGRKGVRIDGADCYGHYFSGGGRDMATRFALPAVADHVWKSLYTGGADSREEFIESPAMLSALNARLATPHPQLAYLHFLDLHAPYMPSSAPEPDAHEEKMSRFMDSCYRAGCDLEVNDSLIAYAKASFEDSLADVDRQLARLLEIAESRPRPYVLVLTADHGELFGEYNGFGHTGGFVPELLSVPFVVYDSRYDYGGAEDCSVALSSHALHSFVQHEVANQGPIQLDTLLSENSSVEIRDSLGVAVLDVASEELRFRIAERMLEQSGTSRNVHTQQEGVLSYPVRACGEATERGVSD